MESGMHSPGQISSTMLLIMHKRAFSSPSVHALSFLNCSTANRFCATASTVLNALGEHLPFNKRTTGTGKGDCQHFV
jgi:hypothetical protein